MENLAPPLLCALEIRASIQNGGTARDGALEFIRLYPSVFAETLRHVVNSCDHGEPLAYILKLAATPLQSSLFILLVRSSSGEPIVPSLNSVIDEMRKTSEAQMDEFAQKLPTQMMLPLLLLQFPAFLILLIGPLLEDFTRSLS